MGRQVVGLSKSGVVRPGLVLPIRSDDMRKRWFVLLAALLAMALAACGGRSRTDTATGADNSADTKPVVTVFKPPS